MVSSVSSPIPLQFYKTDSASGFQKGHAMMAECIGNKVIVWGGGREVGLGFGERGKTAAGIPSRFVEKSRESGRGWEHWSLELG